MIAAYWIYATNSDVLGYPIYFYIIATIIKQWNRALPRTV